MSRLDIVDAYNQVKHIKHSIFSLFGYADVLVNYKTIIQNQENNEFSIESQQMKKDRFIKHFHGTDKKYSLRYWLFIFYHQITRNISSKVSQTTVLSITKAVLNSIFPLEDVM